MLNYEHLLDLAKQEAESGIGAPRQVNLRRAISTAYYAAFHVLLRSVAEGFTSAAPEQWKSRVLFYRALDHATVRNRCKKLGLNPLGKEEAGFFKLTAFSPRLRNFSNLFVELQEKRHKADYDPEFSITKGHALESVDDAGRAIKDLREANDGERKLFLSYLLFGLRT